MNTDKLALRPNCLLTRYPLVFINPARSLFFYEKLAAELQDYASAHGYMVLSPVLAFRNPRLRKLQLQRQLREQKEARFHFILTPQSRIEFAEILELYPDSSLTLSSELSRTSVTAPFSYRLHRLFCRLQGVTTDTYSDLLLEAETTLRERFLDRCVELAENDSL